MKAAIYTRVSTDEQADNYSLPTQLEACQRYAAAHELEVVAEFSDTESGADHDRPGLNKVRDLIRMRAIDALIVYSVDRLARDAALYYIIKSELQRAQVALHYATKGQMPDSADGVLSDGLDVLIARIERLRIAERLQRGRRGKIEGAGGRPGQILGHGANPPYGYTYQGRKKERRLVVQEDEAVIVRNMFIWYTQERLGVGQITDRLTKLRIPTPSDRGRKVAQRERGVGHWSKSSVARILRCPTYTGVMYHFRYRHLVQATAGNGGIAVAGAAHMLSIAATRRRSRPI
jgi:site-specific DNA recombinase